MELRDATTLLALYNRWRRGEDENLDMPNPREIGVALDVVLAALRERDEARAAATWAVEWLDTLTDRFQHDHRIKELFEDIAKERKANAVLDEAWNRCGWTQEQAARFVKNWRREEE
jgi:hypothetical protein